jgi:hypothetical protein
MFSDRNNFGFVIAFLLKMVSTSSRIGGGGGVIFKKSMYCSTKSGSHAATDDTSEFGDEARLNRLALLSCFLFSRTAFDKQIVVGVSGE